MIPGTAEVPGIIFAAGACRFVALHGEARLHCHEDHLTPAAAGRADEDTGPYAGRPGENRV